MSNSTRRLTLAAVWLTLPIVGAIVAATLEPIPPHDYWWHLAMGRLIATGTLPHTNLFLYTIPADLPFVDQPWLGQWLMWLAYDWLGYAGPVLLRNVILAGSFALIVSTAWRRSRDPRAVGALGLLAAILAYPVLTVRTRMFAFAPFAAIVWVCFGVAEGRLSRRWLALAPVVTVFWANAHGSFVLGPAIVFAIGLGVVLQPLIEERRLDRVAVRDWGLTLASVVAAGAISPLGFGVYAYVLQLTVQSNVAQSVTEWLPPDITELKGQIFAGAVVVSLVILFLRRRQVGLGEAFAFAGTLAVSAGAIRGMFWWAAVLPVVVAPHLAALLPPQSEEGTSHRESVVIAIVLTLLLAVAIAVQPGVGRRAIGAATQSGQARQTGEGAWILNHENALDAVAKVRADHRKRVFHDQVLGGMLEFELTSADQPRPVAFVDQRMEFVPEDVWDRYFALSRAAPNWDHELDRIGVDTLLLAHESQWPLIQAALATPRWELVLVDQSHVLLYRASLDGAQHPAEQQ